MNDPEIKIIKQLNDFPPENKINWWGAGEWVDEPDTLGFEYKGYTCLIHRRAVREPYTKDIHIFGGHLCGYVVIPETHSLFGKFEMNDEINQLDCHGGVTFNEGDENEAHLIGFDCTYSNDIVPSMEKLYTTSPDFIALKKKNDEMMERFNIKRSPFFDKHYRNIDYCIKECKGLVNQLIVLEKINEK